MMIFLFALAAQQQSALHLVCQGAGRDTGMDVATVNGRSDWDSYSGTVTARRSDSYEDQVDIRLFTEDDRIRVPRSIVPPIKGGENGWFKVQDLEVSEGQITGKVKLNFLNKPKFVIDRRTGHISIHGRDGNFQGRCAKIEADAPTIF